ncbi:BLUF domain-containing protein [Hymenobacter coccineus]|uniref:BLUF domain-containing protein n=1 Tax=Hymenobacter coccineus TaxID=1908235 RepID=A0A1G1TLL4_9BACT|nr:BLUF domain-containing protein [Hymenobacter coccineus]OGX91767.1 hypothetical protein BEN49_18480 [Hymenobacter coccineus]
MHQLIYASTATQPFSDDELRALLAQARPRNQAAGLRGMLLYSKGLFLQLLEGETAAVYELYYGRIARDLRHRRLHVLADGPLTDYTFPEWHMGFLHTTSTSEVVLDGYLNPVETSFLAKHAPNASPVLRNLLHQFVHSQARARRQ